MYVYGIVAEFATTVMALTFSIDFSMKTKEVKKSLLNLSVPKIRILQIVVNLYGRKITENYPLIE